MNSSLTGKDLLDSFTSGMTTLLTGRLNKLFGSGMDKVIFGSVTWADLAATAIFILLVLAVNVVVLVCVRRKILRSETANAASETKLPPHFPRARQTALRADLDENGVDRMHRLIRDYYRDALIAGSTRPPRTHTTTTARFPRNTMSSPGRTRSSSNTGTSETASTISLPKGSAG